jgi:predicted enzyme involved in methoxymalonyl-ACP biosynthesis
LLHKTNQFNLTAPHRGKLRRLLARRSAGPDARLADRFGDYGLIAVLLGAPADDDPPRS